MIHLMNSVTFSQICWKRKMCLSKLLQKMSKMKGPVDPFMEKFDIFLATVGRTRVKFYLPWNYNIDLLTYPEGKKSRNCLKMLISKCTFTSLTSLSLD